MPVLPMLMAQVAGQEAEVWPQLAGTVPVRPLLLRRFRVARLTKKPPEAQRAGSSPCRAAGEGGGVGCGVGWVGGWCCGACNAC